MKEAAAAPAAARPTGIVERLRAARRRHLARRTSTGHEFAFSDRIDFLNPAHWDALTEGASVFSSRPYLAALESAAPSNVAPRYAVAYLGGTPRAALVMQLAKIRAEDVAPHEAKGECGVPYAPSLPWRRFVAPRVLVCGNLLAWGSNGVRRAPGVSAPETWPVVAEALYRVRSAERLSGNADLIVVKDLTDTEALGVDSLETYSYRSFSTEPDMVLELPETCSSLDAYLGLFRGKYRKAANGVLKDTARAGYRMETLAEPARHAERLHALYLEVHANAKVRPFTLPPTYLPAIASALGDDFRCVAAVRDGRIDGFVTVVRDGRTAVAYTMGYDKAAGAAAPLYLRLLYESVGAALSMGLRRVSFGRTALEPKARLGARPVPLRSWIRHRIPIVNCAIRGWLGNLAHEEAPDRSPFRE